MIKEIILQNITSYHPTIPTRINFSKPRTILFGQNGSGKSTIGRLISAHAKGEQLSQQSNVQSDEKTRYYVYSSDFIRESFYEPSAQPGVFTVGKDDSNIQLEIDQLEKHRELKASQINKLEIDIDEYKKHKENILKRHQDSIFQHKKHYQKDALSYCLKGKSLKASFFDSAMSGRKISDATLDDLVREKEKLDAFSVEVPMKPELINTHTPESDITKLLESPLVSTSTSYFSSLIEKLHNQHWVRDGREYLKHSDVCPFCQKTPTNEFQEQLDQVFNSHYDDAISKLNTYKEKYENYVQSVKEQLNSDKLAYIENNAEFQKIKNKFIDYIETNEKLIVEKIKHPEKIINLIEQASLSTKINTLIEAARLDIDGYSTQLAQKKTIETNIEKQFWGLINEDLSKVFSDYKEEIRLADIEIEKK